MGLVINHENGHNIKPMELDGYPDKYYIKKWWLNHIFKDKNGNDLEFKGWICTIALDPKDFPESIEGTFWVEGAPKEHSFYGHFDIGYGEKDNYVYGNIYPIYIAQNVNYKDNPTREGAEKILKSNEPTFNFPKFEAKIEDCLKLENTYIDIVRN